MIEISPSPAIRTAGSGGRGRGFAKCGGVSLLLRARQLCSVFAGAVLHNHGTKKSLIIAALSDMCIIAACD
jgi:hypothetical protein